jgi:aspartyl/asparaginyl beta-hydroxylase (cupin superfamily)
MLRYEKGNFKSGYCVLKDQNIVIVNKFFDLTGKINCLLEIMKSIELDSKSFSEKNRNFYLELQQTELAL